MRRIENEVDSGRGSPVGSGSFPSMRRKRNKIRGNGKTPLTYSEALHPRRLAELGQFETKEYDDYYYGVGKTKPTEISENYNLKNDNYHDDNDDEIYVNNENVNCRKKSNKKSYHCPSTGKLHSTLLPEYTDPKGHGKKPTKCCSKRESKHRIRNSENIEKLMKLILAQGATIQNQLQKLKEREEQIESIEQERHRERIEKNGRNYLLETYLGSLKDAEIPAEVDEEKADDSGVNTEVGSDQLMIGIKKKNLSFETELESDDVNEKINEKENPEQVRRSQDEYKTHSNRSILKIHKKTARSKSESRSQEYKSEITIKRTLSDNSLENVDGMEKKSEKIKRESSEEVVELRKIQSQIEIWEKVFKINKKLEKEEENLVRLHLKIKKYQNDNYRLTKEKINDGDKEGENVVDVQDKKSWVDHSGEDDGLNDENDYHEIKKNLETLKSDLDHNSKEIYNNFTKLIEEDERVEQKRNCLTKLISDLERTNLEQDMLNEMINMREKKTTENNTGNECDEEKINFNSFTKTTNLQTDGNASIPPPLPSTCTDNNNTCSINYHLPHQSELFSNNNNNQSNEKIDDDVIDKKVQQQQFKPKTVKISFEDKVQSCENLDNKESGLPTTTTTTTTTTVPVGALKGILKNRKQKQFFKNTDDVKIIDSQKFVQNNHERSNGNNY